MKVSKPILFALGFAIVFSLYLVFFTGKKKPPPQIPPPQHASAVSVAAAVREGSKPGEFTPQSGKLDVSWDRDPFALPRALPEKRLEEPRILLKLVAIVEGKNGRVAIFGNEIVGKGDAINGEKVLEIGKDRVVLVRNGSRRTISIAESAPEVSKKTEGGK